MVSLPSTLPSASLYNLPFKFTPFMSLIRIQASKGKW